MNPQKLHDIIIQNYFPTKGQYFLNFSFKYFLRIQILHIDFICCYYSKYLARVFLLSDI